MITIDGVSISAATIDGSDVQEITADGDTVWTASALEIAANLYSGSATFTFYEDVTGDGTADNQQEYTLIEGVNEYDVTNFDLSPGSRIWYSLVLDNQTVSETVEVEYIEVKYQ